MPRKTQLLIKVFVNVNTCSSYLNYVSSTSLDIITLNLSSSERRAIVLLTWKVSKFLVEALFANARRGAIRPF